MPIKLPPDVATLRKLVRGQLTREDRIEVDLWLGRCQDDRILNVLDYLGFEWNQEKQDHICSESIQTLSFFVTSLWEKGKAVFDQPITTFRAVATLCGTPQCIDYAEGLHLIRDDEDKRLFRIKVYLTSTPARAMVVATNDQEEFHILTDERNTVSDLPFEPRKVDDYRIEDSEGRVTFWLFASDTVDDLDPKPDNFTEFVKWVDRTAKAPSVQVYVHKITEEYESDE